MKYSSCKLCGKPTTVENKTNELIKCSSCKLTFYENDFADIDIASYYKDVYETDYHNYNKTAAILSQGEEVKIGYNKEHVMERVMQNNPKKIAEFGAGIGLIANYLKNKNVSYTGFELVKHVVDQAKEKGLNVEQGDFTVLANYEKEFDTVLAFEVIEHIDNLKHCLSLVYNSLKEGGRFGFTVPNYDKRLNYTGKGDKLYQIGPPVHVNFFTKESIQQMASLFGFQIEYLAVRSFPQRQKSTMEFLRLVGKKLTGSFHGPNVFCILKK